MIETYSVTSNGLQLNDKDGTNFIIYNGATIKEHQDFINQYNFPENLFDFYETPTIAPHIDFFHNDYLGKTLVISIANPKKHDELLASEKRLETHTFIYSSNQLFWFINSEESNLKDRLFKNYQEKITSLESIIIYAGLLSYSNFTNELMIQKTMIENLTKMAEQNTSRKTLLDIAKTEHNLVILEHTIDEQESVFTSLLNNAEFIKRLDNANLIYDIKWSNRQVKKLVHVYRDLLDTVSSLYSDIMSNTLNVLMKFLSSFSLILASSSLVAEIWGMNTGGLPFESHEYGTLIMVSFAFIVGILMYLILKSKKFF